MGRGRRPTRPRRLRPGPGRPRGGLEDLVELARVGGLDQQLDGAREFLDRLDADSAQPGLQLEGLARVLHREDRAPVAFHDPPST
jgi:hypothetical protein